MTKKKSAAEKAATPPREKSYLGLAVVQPHITGYDPKTKTNTILYVLFVNNHALQQYLSKDIPKSRGLPIIGTKYVTRISEDAWRELKRFPHGTVWAPKGLSVTFPLAFFP